MIRMSAQSVTIPDRPWVPAGPRTFGDRIRQIRIDLDMDAQTAAALCGVPKNSWLNWEKGKRPQDLERVARQISDKLNVPLIYLLTGETTGFMPRENLTLSSLDEFCLAEVA